MSTPFAAEIAFLRRKTPTMQTEWKALPAVSQLMSQQYKGADQASNLRDRLHEALKAKAGDKFANICFVTNNPNGFRVVINILKLREVFADEIDGGGGGGRSIKPISADYAATRMGRR